MTDPHLKVPGSRRSGQEFLFYQTRTQAEAEPPTSCGSTAPDTALPADLAPLYPNLLGDAALLAAAAACIGTRSRFAVLAIRLDPSQPDTETAGRQALAASLDRICRVGQGLWGWMASGLFACWLPEADEDACQAAADTLAADLKACAATATIGMALYPTLDYAADRIWTNACKALDHAAFFGADSRVFFDAVSLNISGDRIFETGDIQGAVAEFEKALELDPNEVNVLNSLGVCWSHLGNSAKALVCFEQAARLDPTEAMAWYNIGLVMATTGADTHQALDRFREADRLSPDVFEIKLQIGKLCLESADLTAARAALEKAVALKPASALAHRLLGQCFEQMGHAADAVALLRKAVKLNPNDAEALSLLGALLDQLGENPEVALAFCRHSVELAPETAVFRRRLARLYENTGEAQKAAAELAKAEALEQPAVEKNVTRDR